MAYAKPLFLSLCSGAALALVVTPGCNSSSAPVAEVAISTQISLGNNSSTTCGVGGGVTWAIGSFGDPIVTAQNGGTFSSIPVTASCDVSQNGSNYDVKASVNYGEEGSLTISGTIVGAQGSASTWPTEQNITATFGGGSQSGFIETLSESNCTISFSSDANMGIAPTRIWGSLSCPTASSSDGTTCAGTAEFLFENCLQ
jgi:hypothetical protein